MNLGKYTSPRARPPGARNSFPSGHTATAFMAAEFLRMEFGHISPAITLVGYGFALTTTTMRIVNDRHWLTDTVAGAGVGILSVKIAYWLAPSVNRLIWGSDLRSTRISTSFAPIVGSGQYGLSVGMRF